MFSFPTFDLAKRKVLLVSFLKILCIGIEDIMYDCVCYVGRLSCIGTHTARVIWQESSLMTPHVLPIVVIAIQRKGLPLRWRSWPVNPREPMSPPSLPRCLSSRCVITHLAFTKFGGS